MSATSRPPNREPHQHSERCVICGYPESRHSLAVHKCPTGFQTMNLPPGKTCADCIHTSRCVAIFGVIPEDQRCDFFPVRYREREG